MNSSERVNIIKLAKELNLSKSTVSWAFRGASDINPQTRDRILEKARELKFLPASVTSNEYLSSFGATEYLINNGSKRIAYLVINKKTSRKNQRKGYADALAANGISFDEELIIDCGNEPAMIREKLSDVFQTMMPDGVFASGEKLTIASCSVCHELGIGIPADLRITGFCNSEISSFFDPSLSIIAKPAFDMGGEAARLLFRMLGNNEIEKGFLNEQIVLKSRLIQCQSSVEAMR